MKELSHVSNDELIDHAMKAYYRHACQTTPSLSVPSRPCCDLRNGIILVVNTYGVLAEYRVGPKRLIRAGAA